MLLTGVALSTGLLLIGQGCMSAAPKGATSPIEAPHAAATTTTTTTNATVEASIAPRPFTPHHRAPANEEIAIAASMEDDSLGVAPAIAIDGDRPCRFMKAQAGNTKGPSYMSGAEVCVR
jgi:hypothetical protein